jgi:hypothetical protein
MKVSRNAVLTCLAICFVFTASRCASIVGVIYGNVWDDKNENGVIDEDEEGVAGVNVQLLNEVFVVIAETTTNSSGDYTFTDLEYTKDSSFEVRVTAPPGQAFTQQGSMGNEYASHVDPTGVSDKIVLTDNQNKQTINAGLIAAPPPEPEEDASLPPTDEPTQEPSGDTTAGDSDAGPCGSNDNPVSWDMEYTTDNGDPYTLHFTFWGPTNLLYFYAPAVHFDGTDAYQVIAPLVQMLPGGVVGFTGTGCQGGCTQWLTNIWFENAEHATMQLDEIECLLPDYQVVMIGASSGGELGLFICPYWDRCIVGASISPNTYYGVPLEELLESAQLAQRTWIFGWGTRDREMVAIEGYVTDKVIIWDDVNQHQEAEQNGFTFTPTDTADHGRDWLTKNPWFWDHFPKNIGKYR